MQEIIIRQKRGVYRTGLLASCSAWIVLVAGLTLGLTEPSPEERCSLTLLCGLFWLMGYCAGRRVMHSYRHDSLVIGNGKIIFQDMFRRTDVKVDEIHEIRWYGNYRPIAVKVIARSFRQSIHFTSFAKRSQSEIALWFRNAMPLDKQSGWKPNFDAWLKGKQHVPIILALFPSPPPSETREQHWHFIRWLSIRTLMGSFLVGLLFGVGLELFGDNVREDLPARTGVIWIDWILYGLGAGVSIAVMFFLIGWTEEPEDDPGPTATRKAPVR